MLITEPWMEKLPPDEPHRPARVVVSTTELRCMMCSRYAGQVVSRAGGHILHRPDSPPMQVADLRRLRCEDCGGNVVAGESETRMVREHDEPFDDGAPRRGRPPRWLIEQRLATAALRAREAQSDREAAAVALAAYNRGETSQP